MMPFFSFLLSFLRATNNRMDCQQKVPPDSSMSSKNTTLNPFEADSVDSLHLTQFSPSVFSKSVLTPSSSQVWYFHHPQLLPTLNPIPTPRNGHCLRSSEHAHITRNKGFYLVSLLPPSVPKVPYCCE